MSTAAPPTLLYTTLSSGVALASSAISSFQPSGNCTISMRKAARVYGARTVKVYTQHSATFISVSRSTNAAQDNKGIAQGALCMCVRGESMRP